MVDFMTWKVLPTDNIYNSTFDFDLDCEDFTGQEFNDEQLSIKDFGLFRPGIYRPEFNWNGDISVSKKRLLLREERDPNLSECRLDYESSQKEEGNSSKRQKDHDKERKINKIGTLSIEEKQQLTERILKPDKDGDNLLFIAIISDHTDLTLLLIDLISDHSCLNIHNKLYQTALHLAALTNNSKVTRRLVVAGIEIDMRDRLGNTALHIACRKGLLDVAKALVTAVTYRETKLNTYKIPYQPIPQNFDIRNSEGLACLHIAVIHKHKDIVDLLLSKDANINVIEMKAGKTCLHLAAESGSEQMVEFILSKSRPILSKKTFAGFTACELAHYHGHDHIVYMLRCRGALEARPIETIERTLTVGMDYLTDHEENEENGDSEYNEENSDDEDSVILID